MSKDGVIYASGVKKRTDHILRAFAAKNDLTLSQLMDILAHVVAGYGTMHMFNGTVRDFDPQFEHFDHIVRDWMEKNTPEAYRRIPVLQRFFGRVFKPLTRGELDRIDVELLKEDAPSTEVPDVRID
jgi:hypothetical protein